MSRWTHNLPTYLQIITLRLQVSYTYRAALVIQLVGLLLKVYLLTIVFVAVYAGRATVDGIALDQVLTVVTLANVQGFLFVPAIGSYMRERVRYGQIALDLARPAPFFSQLVAHQVGATVAVIPLVLIALPVAVLIGGIQAPPSLTAGLLYLGSVGLGYLVAVLLGVVIGLMAFWTVELDGVLTIYVFANQFFGGALVPLWFFPPLLRRVAELLPFQAQTFVPLAMYTGQLAGAQALQALMLQLLWVGLLFALARLVYHRALYRVVIQGG